MFIYYISCYDDGMFLIIQQPSHFHLFQASIGDGGAVSTTKEEALGMKQLSKQQSTMGLEGIELVLEKAMNDRNMDQKTKGKF